MVGRRLLDPRLEVAARDMDRAGNPPLGPLVELADVDDERPVAGRKQIARAGDVDLVDLRLDLLQQLPVARHRFRKCSDPLPGYARNVAIEASPLAASRNRRIVLVVALAALAAAAAVVGATLLQGRGEGRPCPAR